MLWIVKVGVMVLGLALWLWSQRLLGDRPAPGKKIEDWLHVKTLRYNRFLNQSRIWSNVILISTSLFIDLFGLLIFASSILGPSFRPFIGLMIIFTLRQINQAITALPMPEGLVWRSPGVPSILVTYDVAADFFFSGHTAIAVYGALELARLGSPLLTALGILIAVYEAIAVILLRAHWTMDVFTGALCALWVDQVASGIAPSVDQWILSVVHRLS